MAKPWSVALRSVALSSHIIHVYGAQTEFFFGKVGLNFMNNLNKLISLVLTKILTPFLLKILETWLKCVY